jgi:branched-chain amino acid transport system permease protein
VSRFITFAVFGLSYGCVYSLAATGLVLTFRTSGVFNMAFGAQAYGSAAVYYAAVKESHWNRWAGLLLAVVVVGPLLGFALDRVLFRHIRTAPQVVKLITALGLLVGIPSVAQFFFGTDNKPNPPDAFWSSHTFYRFLGSRIDGNQLSIIVTAVAVVVALGLFLRFTSIGLQMRAVVESPRMVQLAGINADRVGTTAWVLSGLIAGLAGVLLAPTHTALVDRDFTLLLVAAMAAAAFGRLISLPLTLLGGLAVGVGQEVLAGYLPLNSVWAKGLRPSFPFLVLVGLLLFLPGLRQRRDTTDPLAACDPPTPALAASHGDPRLRRINRVTALVGIPAIVFLPMLAYHHTWLNVMTLGVVFSTIMLSITALTGLSGQISLCQFSLAGVGAFTAGQLATRYDLSVLWGILIGAAVAAAVGALISLPALRLGGVYLALATLAFALMADNFLFPLHWVGGGQSGVQIPKPVGFSGEWAFFFLSVVVLAICGGIVVLVRKGTTGQYLAALRGSETAAATIGISPARAKFTVFAVSAGIAGAGGALYGSSVTSVNSDQFNFFLSLAFMVLVLTTGVRTVEGAVNAGIAFAVIPFLLDKYASNFNVLVFALFAYGSLTYAKHPEGIVEFQKRRSLAAITRWLDRKQVAPT